MSPLRRRATVAVHALAGMVAAGGLLAELWRPTAPTVDPLPPATAFFDASYIARAEAFREPLYVAGAAVLAVRLAVPALLALTPPGRRLVDRVVTRIGPHRPSLAATGVVLGTVVATDVMLSPVAFWSGYLHEHAYGLSTQDVSGWAYDWLVAKAPAWAAVAALTLGGYWLARRLPRTWPAVGGLGAVGLGIGLTLLAPLVIEPLVFRFEPLPPGPLRDEVEQVLRRAGEQVDQILVADASRRTTRQNAYVSGLGATRRVVLYDTLVEQRPPDEVTVVLAHELGHRRNADVLRGTLFGGTGAVVVAYSLAALGRRRSHSGSLAAPWDPRGAAGALAVVIGLNLLSAPLQSVVSRRAEAAADLAALELSAEPAAYVRMQQALTRSNLGDPDPPAWAVRLWSTHPPAVARLGLAARRLESSAR